MAMLSRRRLVALVSAVLMLTIAAAAVGAFVLATQSEGGRERIRAIAEKQLARTMRGKVHLGTLSGSFLTDLRIDSVRIADADDSLFIATGPVRVTFDPRDLAEGRIILRTVEAERPHVIVRQELDGRWTHEKLWPPSAVRRTLRRRSAFGAVFVLEQAQVRDGAFTLLLPWAPDSAPTQRRTRAWAWSAIQLDVPRARLAYPDSVGMHFAVARLDVVESDPPFTFSGLEGDVRLGRDTVWFDVPRFSLPGSVGRGLGRVTWVRGEPVGYAIRVEADSMSLADVAWLDPALPSVGGGRVQLDITNAPGDPRAIAYAISGLDVRTHRSRVLGRMRWDVGSGEVALRDVDLEFSPLDVELLERFNRGPLPVPLRGQMTGRLRASGGPFTDFAVDAASVTFRDGNVPGVVARARARGRLDISVPAVPVFHGLDLDVDEFDLRSAQALDSGFPRLNGILRGTARLDSAWGDLRAADFDLTHRDGSAPESRLRGSAHLQFADGPLRWDVSAIALPLSFTALAKSFEAFPLRGEFDGQLGSRGSAADLRVVTDLLGPSGRLESDVRLVESPQRRVAGRMTLTNVDPRALAAREALPTGELTARLAMDVQGDSLADLDGDVQLVIDRSTLDGARIFAGTARLRFGGGRAVLDTLYLESSAIDVAGRGALGLRPEVSDTLQLRARMDSLGGLRPWLGRVAGDTLDGSAMLDARAVGWVREFSADATAVADRLLVAGARAAALRAEASMPSVSTSGRLRFDVDVDSVVAAGFAIREGRVIGSREDGGDLSLGVVARGPAGTVLRGGAALRGRADTLELHIDSLALNTAVHRWQLRNPGSLLFAEGGFRADALELRTNSGSVLAVAGAMPARGALDFRFNAERVLVADVAELLQVSGRQEGEFDLLGRLEGTRQAPRFAGEAELRGGFVKGVRLDTLRARLSGLANRLDARLALGSRDRPGLSAEVGIPVRLGLDGEGFALLEDGALTGRIRADSLGLGVFEVLTRGTSGPRGSASIALDLAGTYGAPRATGTLRVRNGFLAPAPLGNVRWRNVEADVVFHGDSISVNNLSAVSGANRGGRAQLSGWTSLADRENPRFDFRLAGREFNALARPGLADIDLSGELRLSGAWRGATLRGALTADRAIISIPELATKDVISLEGPDGFGAVDTVVVVNGRTATGAPSAFIENLTVAGVPIRMGRDVWIRSSEANINLGGQVSVARGRVTRGPATGQQQLALDGSLQTVRGTYRLNLGPVQRTFEVEQGEIRFFGDAELNPSLDISALHTVRQYSEQGARPDVRVRVHLGGTLQQPSAELSTPDSLRVTNADLISYLVTGGPSFEIGGRNGDISATAARVLLGSFGSVLGGRAAGGLCDDAQVSTAGLDSYGGRARNVGGGILAGTRFNCAKQVGDRAFVRLDAGLCQVGQLVTQSGGGDPLSFTDALGVKLDYLVREGLSASIGVEPPTSAVLCAVNANASARGFVPTPRQVGFDLFRVWRF